MQAFSFFKVIFIIFQSYIFIPPIAFAPFFKIKALFSRLAPEETTRAPTSKWEFL